MLTTTSDASTFDASSRAQKTVKSFDVLYHSGIAKVSFSSILRRILSAERSFIGGHMCTSEEVMVIRDVIPLSFHVDHSSGRRSKESKAVARWLT